MTVPIGPLAPAGEYRAALRVRLEPAAALAACIVAAIAASWNLLRPGVFSEDAFVHQYWMWSYRDGALFDDPLTAELRESARYPAGYVLLFRLAIPFASPITAGEWLGVAMMALSAFLVFLIVREHTSWKPAAWLAAALFLALFDLHRFHGGFPRAFVHPVVLGCVLLAIRQRHLPAALLAGGAALLYPPAAVLAVGLLMVSAVRWRPARRRPSLDRHRAGAAGLAAALLAAIVLGPSLLGSGSPAVLSAAEARRFPEFGVHGPLHYFADSWLGYLRQNRSGLDLRVSGSILALAALGLPALARLRPASGARLRPEVLALPVVALGSWAVAQAVLFQLYLPHRFTYPLLAFFAIAAGVALRPAWEAVAARAGARVAALVLAPLGVAALAACAFPLGPLWSPDRLLTASTIAVAGAAVAVAALVFARRAGPAAGAAATGAVLLAVVLAVPAHGVRGSRCPGGPAVRYLGTLPKDAIVAGDPADMKCLPATARRAVVTSTQLAPAYEKDYFLDNRKRMFALLDAVYGPDPRAIAELRSEYGATHLWIRRNAVEAELRGDGIRWHRRRLPYGRHVRRLASTGRPASLALPAACRTFARGPNAVYDIRCLAHRPAFAHSAATHGGRLLDNAGRGGASRRTSSDVTGPGRRPGCPARPAAGTRTPRRCAGRP